MKGNWIAGPAAALAVAFLAAIRADEAAAQRSGRDGPSMGKGDARGPTAGPRVEGPRASPRSFTRERSRTHSYTLRSDRRDGRRHVRRFRGERFVYGAPLYGTYAYGPCQYYYERAIATGREYWWDRYYTCTGGDYD